MISIRLILPIKVAREEWDRIINRKDRPLTMTSRICSAHFDERDIITADKHIINGKEFIVPRFQAALVRGAVPVNLQPVSYSRAYSYLGTNQKENPSSSSPQPQGCYGYGWYWQKKTTETRNDSNQHLPLKSNEKVLILPVKFEREQTAGMASRITTTTLVKQESEDSSTPPPSPKFESVEIKNPPVEDMLEENTSEYQSVMHVEHLDPTVHVADGCSQMTPTSNTQAEDCKKQWKSLRDKCLRLANLETLGIEKECKYKGKMQYNLEFAKPRKYQSGRPSIAEAPSMKQESQDIPASPAVSTSSGSSSTCDKPDLIQRLSESLVESEVVVHSNGRLSDSENRMPTTSKPTANSKATKRKIAEPDESQILIETAKKLLKVVEDRKRTNTSNRAFVEYMLARLNEMPEEEACKKRIEIARILERSF